MPDPSGCLRLGLGLIFVVAGTASAGAQRPDYPATRTVDLVQEMKVVDILRVADPYRWLENGDDPEVQAWTRQQNALTRRLLDQFAEQRARLAERFAELYAVHIGSAPQTFGDRVYFLKRTGLQDHAVLYVREGGHDAEPRVALDPNLFSPDGTVALDWWHPSPDGALVAYGKSADGSEKSTLHVRDVRTGVDLPPEIPHTAHAAVAWDPDGRGFLYTRYPEPGTVPVDEERYHRHLYYHRLGTDWRADAQVWGEGRAKEEWPEVYNSGDDRYQFLSVELDWTKNDLYVRPAGGPAAFRPVAVGLEGLFEADVLGDRLLVRTNFRAPRYRLVAADVADPAPERWQDVLPEQKGVIHELLIADGKLVVHVLENAYSRLLICEPEGQLIREVEVPTLGSVSELSGRPDRHDLFFRFESFAYPPVVFHYDLGAHTMKAIDRLGVGVELDRYETRQLWFNSRDDTRVPLFVTYRKGLALDGSHPAVLTGYGGFNISLTPEFDRGILPWLDAGGVWAVANLRGGGEFGQAWHQAGQREHKQNVFDDLIAAAEKLIADGYTRPERLGVQGGSNGGLLAGAVLTQRPDLFRAVQAAVPLMDMLRYHLFAPGRYYLPEYGDPENPEHLRYLHAYSPYHNVRDGTAYPAVLLTTADGDGRVDPMHARKMAARLQAATRSDHPVLLWVEAQAGHTVTAKPLARRLDELVDVWTFFVWQLGGFESGPTTAPAPSPTPP